jgi:hypothetical protein
MLCHLIFTVHICVAPLMDFWCVTTGPGLAAPVSVCGHRGAGCRSQHRRHHLRRAIAAFTQ